MNCETLHLKSQSGRKKLRYSTTHANPDLAHTSHKNECSSHHWLQFRGFHIYPYKLHFLFLFIFILFHRKLGEHVLLAYKSRSIPLNKTLFYLFLFFREIYYTFTSYFLGRERKAVIMGWRSDSLPIWWDENFRKFSTIARRLAFKCFSHGRMAGSAGQ